MMSYHWPGNVRERENVLERRAACDGDSRSSSAVIITNRGVFRHRDQGFSRDAVEAYEKTSSRTR
jgi:transcriptional regulator with GAF, ATPase, and Fis domain